MSAALTNEQLIHVLSGLGRWRNIRKAINVKNITHEITVHRVHSRHHATGDPCAFYQTIINT